MLVLVAAISGVATLVAALWMFLFHEDFGISFFIEQKSHQNNLAFGIESLFPVFSGTYLEKILHSVDATVGAITNEAEMVNGQIKRIGEKLYSDLSVFKHSLEESEYFQPIKNIASSVADGAIMVHTCLMDMSSSLGSSDWRLRWMYGVVCGCCCLYVLLRYGEDLSRLSSHNEEIQREESEGGRKGATKSQLESQENDSASSVDWSDYVYGIETIYDKVKSILEDARCLSRRQHNTADDILSRTSPKISDVSSLLDSLGDLINEGTQNLIFLTHQYRQVDIKVLKTEEKLNSKKAYQGCGLEKIHNFFYIVNEQDAEIRELEGKIKELKCEVNYYSNVKKGAKKDLDKVREDLCWEGMRSDSLLVLKEMAIREARNRRDAMFEEIEKGIRRRKSMRESYVRNMRVLLRMLLKSSSNISDWQIENFLSSKKFEEFVDMGEFPTELGSDIARHTSFITDIVKNCIIS